MSTVVNLEYIRNRLAFRVTNTGGTDLNIDEVYMTFPAGNSTLMEVSLPPYFFWQGEKTSPATVDTPYENTQKLKAGKSVIMYFVFENVAEPTGYYIKVTFDDATFAEITVS